MSKRARSRIRRGGGRSRIPWPAGVRTVSVPELRVACDPKSLERAVKKEAKAASAEVKALAKEIPDAGERRRQRERARLAARPDVSLDELVGQRRALEALQSALGTEAPGFHPFVTGPPGSGRQALVRAALRELQPPLPRPRDRVYVANFRHPNRPCLLTLPRGKGRRFVRDLDDVLAALRRAIPAALQHESHVAKVERMRRRATSVADGAIEDVAAELRTEGLIVGTVPEGYATPELKLEVAAGAPLALRTVERRIQAGDLKATRKVKRLLRRYPDALAALERAAGEARAIMRRETLALRRLDARVAKGVARGFTEDLAGAYPTRPVARWLSSLLEAIGSNVALFNASAEEDEETTSRVDLAPLNLFRANLFVDAKELPAPPILFEANPTYQNLLGSLDTGEGLPDHMRLRAGSLLRANGGVLLVEGSQLFNNEVAWAALKRAVKSGWLEVQRGQGNALRPDPIRTAVKVIGIGSEDLYEHMYSYDPDFFSVFKVKVQLEGALPRTKPNVQDMARALSRIARRGGLRTPDAPALARLIEYASRLAGRNDRLQPAFGQLLDVLQEADRMVGPTRSTLGREAVDQALERMRRRHDLCERQAQELLDDGIVLLEVEGQRVGVINALVVYDEGIESFSRPTRVTAAVGMGREGLVDIEREGSFSGGEHSKGIAIVGAILRERFAQDKPLCLTASVCFEQNYTIVDGDSASLAETLAVLSALGGFPLEQGWGVTGSINQKGEVQPIGDVNAKIEGFFDTCAARGLTGQQGVIIPESNVRDLMLRPDVVQAVADGRFHVVCVRALDDALELVSGLPPGQRPTPFEPFPEGTAHARVDARLTAYAQAARRYAMGL